MTDAIWHNRNLQNLPNAEVQNAYLHLVFSALRAGMNISPENTAITAVRIYRDEAYKYAFIINQADLLFYIRKPALAADPDLAMVGSNFRDAKENPAGEHTIRISALADAEQLTSLVSDFSKR